VHLRQEHLAQAIAGTILDVDTISGEAEVVLMQLAVLDRHKGTPEC
jgi:hypothetical protein